MRRHGASSAEDFELFGKDFGLIHEFVVAGRKLGMNRAFYSALTHCKDFFGAVVSFIHENFFLDVIVDYDISKESLGRGRGCKVDDFIDDQLLRGGKIGKQRQRIYFLPIGKLGLAEMRFENPSSLYEAVIEIVYKLGYMPIDVAALVAIAKQYPGEIIGMFSCFAFGSVKGNYVPELSYDDSHGRTNVQKEIWAVYYSDSVKRLADYFGAIKIPKST